MGTIAGARSQGFRSAYVPAFGLYIVLFSGVSGTSVAKNSLGLFINASCGFEPHRHSNVTMINRILCMRRLTTFMGMDSVAWAKIDFIR